MSADSSATRHRHHHHHQSQFSDGDEVKPLVALGVETVLNAGDDDEIEVKPTTDSPRIRSSRLIQTKGVFGIIIGIYFFLWFSTGDVTKPPSSTGAHSKKIKHRLDITFISGVSAYDDAFDLALTEVAMNIHDEDDGAVDLSVSESKLQSVGSKFVAGAGWDQLWTRDTSYALELSLALLYPETSKSTLQVLTETQRDGSSSNKNITTWYQDICGHFGGWPNLTDAIVGAQGSWSLYLATGDIKMLKWAYQVTSDTLKFAETQVLDHETSGLFKGCSTFLESNSGYPRKYHKNGSLVGKTKALSTNVLYYNGYRIAAEMAKELQQQQQRKHTNANVEVTDHNDDAELSSTITTLRYKADKLKHAIHARLWMEDKGYYSYFEDENSLLVPQMEGLGESLLLLADELETNQTRKDQIFRNTPRTAKGLPCLWPRFEGQQFKLKDTSTYYHNGRIWPFVQGYWAIAAARHGQVAIFAEELDHLVELALGQPPAQYKRPLITGEESVDSREEQPTFAEFYETNATFVHERRRQLWSGAGYLGMILQGLFGIQLEPRGIRFRPVKPKHLFDRTIELRGLSYRQAMITIKISGYGSVVNKFVINGKSQKGDPFLASEAKGKQVIEIKLKQKQRALPQ